MRTPGTLQKCLATSLACVLIGTLYCGADFWPLVRRYPHLLDDCGPIACVLGVLVLNLTTWLFILCRFVLLRETGRKLAHFEKQLLTGETVQKELSERFRSQ